MVFLLLLLLLFIIIHINPFSEIHNAYMCVCQQHLSMFPHKCIKNQNNLFEFLAFIIELFVTKERKYVNHETAGGKQIKMKNTKHVVLPHPFNVAGGKRKDNNCVSKQIIQPFLNTEGYLIWKHDEGYLHSPGYSSAQVQFSCPVALFMHC